MTNASRNLRVLSINAGRHAANIDAMPSTRAHWADKERRYAEAAVEERDSQNEYTFGRVLLDPPPVDPGFWRGIRSAIILGLVIGCIIAGAMLLA